MSTLPLRSEEIPLQYPSLSTYSAFRHIRAVALISIPCRARLLLHSSQADFEGMQAHWYQHRADPQKREGGREGTQRLITGRFWRQRRQSSSIFRPCFCIRYRTCIRRVPVPLRYVRRVHESDHHCDLECHRDVRVRPENPGLRVLPRPAPALLANSCLPPAMSQSSSPLPALLVRHPACPRTRRPNGAP